MTLTNVILSRSERGWVESGDLASEVANGRAERSVSFGGIKDLDRIHAVAEQLVAVAGTSYVASIAGYEPAASGDEPYIGFGIYDRVDALDPSGSVEQAVVHGITCTTDTNGHPTWTVEANGLAVVEEQATDRWLRRALPAYAGGTTETATPAAPPSNVLYRLDSAAKKWTASKDGPLEVGALSGLNQWIGKRGHANRFLCTLTTVASSGSTVILFKIDGTTIATVTIPAGDDTGYAILHSTGFEGVTPFDSDAKFRVVIDEVGTGAEGLVAEVWWF